MCRVCELVHKYEDEADGCCDHIEKTEGFFCPTCESFFNDALPAFQCCDENKLMPSDSDELDEGLAYRIRHKNAEDAGQECLF